MTSGGNLRSRALRRPLAHLALILGLLLCGAATTAPVAGAEVRTATTVYGKGERIQTVPISKGAWEQPRSVMSLSPAQLGTLRSGDRIEGIGDVELTICLKPDPRHPGEGQPCVGDLYGYNPTLRAKLVLAPSADAASGSQTQPISKTVSVECRQDHPVRNHHCTLQTPWQGKKIDAGRLPCEPDSCHLNMVVSASHPQARDGERVVVGSSDDNKRIHQGLARLSAAVLSKGSKPAKVWQSKKPRSKTLPVGSKGGGVKKQVVYSQRIGPVKAGDQLLVEARTAAKIKHLPYNVFQRTEVVLAKKPGSIKQAGKIVDTTARVGAANGFNCTRKKSGHGNPCRQIKGGVLSVGKNSKGPWFVNVVAGQHAIGTAPSYRKWRAGDRSKMRKGLVRVERYKGGSSSCKTCQTGWQKFSPNNPPEDGRIRNLVADLGSYAISEGSYNCRQRTSPSEYVCDWRSSGDYGGTSPKWECDSKAWLPQGSSRWRINVCKDAIGAALWRTLELKLGISPTFAGKCEELGSGAVRCKWFAKGVFPSLIKYFCQGFGTFHPDRGSWNLDPCRNERENT